MKATTHCSSARPLAVAELTLAHEASRKQNPTSSLNRRAAWVAILLGSCACASWATGFSDNFEGSTLDPFWTNTLAQSGDVNFPSTTRAHNGSQSLELVSTNSSGLNKSVALQHFFDAPTYGTVSVWVYDTGADESSANYIQLALSLRSVPKLVGALYTFDYDLGQANGGTYHYLLMDGGDNASSRDRTQTWHKWTIRSLTNSLTLSVDGVVVYSGAGGQPFDVISLSLSAPDWRPAWAVQFDDFEFTAESAPAPATLDIHMYAGLTITGSIGATYDIQHTTSLTGTNWEHLTDITLPTSPFLYVDTTSPATGQRFYRAVQKP